MKLAELASELDKVNLNELTPIDALNTLVKIKQVVIWLMNLIKMISVKL